MRRLKKLTLLGVVALVLLGYYLYRLAHPITPPLAEHKYHDDGLLEVNPYGRHPIYDLVARAEQEWEAKQGRASRTLHDAVVEYKRRYKRDPPKGFDKWWVYVEQHNVQLPDEYDQIHRDLEMYWGMAARDLNHLYNELEDRKTDFVVLLKAEDGSFGVDNMLDNPDSSHQPVWSVMEMLTEVAEHLPPFRAIFTHDDRPNRLKEFDIENALMHATKG